VSAVALREGPPVSNRLIVVPPELESSLLIIVGTPDPSRGHSRPNLHGQVMNLAKEVI
jgi:hypothetical protein